MTLGTRDSGLGHASFEMESRHAKAGNIGQLLELAQFLGDLRLLEVGTGAGGHAVANTSLSFADVSFDVALSNRGIARVGDESEQLKHPAELRGGLSPTGIGYLAVPNRWMLVEPHYRVAFLSWLPRTMHSPCLCMAGNGQRYDCEPLQKMRQLAWMLVQSGLASWNMCIEALRATFEVERPGTFADRLLRKVSDSVIQPLRPIIPTLICSFWSDQDEGMAGIRQIEMRGITGGHGQ